MKKYIALIMPLLLILCFSACDLSKTNNDITKEEEPTVNQQEEQNIQQDNKQDVESNNPQDDQQNTESNKQQVDQQNTENEQNSPVVNSDYDPCVEYNIPIPVETHTYDNGDKLILVNKQHAITEDFYPTDMVAVDGSLSTNQGLYFKREAYAAYLKMLGDAKEEGINFLICSTYRSYDTQYSIYHSYIKNYGLEYTNSISAYPGRSEHHTGWAVDITSKAMGYGLDKNFINLPEGQWINDHCHEYGFIVRYLEDKTHITGYSYEPWHLRYVGVDVATEIMSKGITLEEYLGVA